MKKISHLYVYNIALKRDDGKVEQDTIFREKLFTADEVKYIAEKHHCGVLLSCVGTFKTGKDDFVKQNSFVVELDTPTIIQNKGE